MECTTVLPLSQLSFFPPKPCNRQNRAYPSRPWKQRTSQPTRFNCQKMYVPGFGEASPEAKAANNLHHFFTYVASYNPEAYKELMEFLSRHSLSDGDKFCADLMRESSRHKSLVLTLENFACLVIGYVGITNDYCVAALRILEVRSAYCKNDFEWDNLERLATKKVDESNTRLMRDYVLETIHGES
ncbi:chaperonin-like RBCX protein 1, chloroplastic isoform X2 [Camellia sinensis]|uniref:chaperonin-like RBCX protein 1, chloroplastic isoform X2 n=1 Tax=Camellia sinensis TaxID=4442 RepID=UPI0010364251|nr:chaperonin-like RBCX protein 1, chloroplastic isoform X2 [Camellia sinensis]